MRSSPNLLYLRSTAWNSVLWPQVAAKRLGNAVYLGTYQEAEKGLESS